MSRVGNTERRLLPAFMTLILTLNGVMRSRRQLSIDTLRRKLTDGSDSCTQNKAWG